MTTNLKAESSLTDRYQTTVPEMVRQALNLGKRDKIRYTIRPNGQVILSRGPNVPEQDDPALEPFLNFLAHDIANHPERLQMVGTNIQTARKRRGWSLEEMAGAMLVTRKTLSRLEAGDPSVGLAVLAAALHSLDMVDDLGQIATPEKDKVGLFHEKRRLAQRVRKKKTPADNLDF